MKKELKPINDIYEQYKHLDPLFSDIEWLKNDDEGGISPMRQALYDFWEAIKREVTRPQRQELDENQLRAIIIDNSSGQGFDIPVNYDVKVNVSKLAKAICQAAQRGELNG
jgi:hypothetical protein